MSRHGGNGYTDSNARPRIVIAGSILLYREGLAASIASDGRLLVAGRADLESAAKVIARLRPSAVVLDASTSNSLVVAAELKRLFPDLALVGFGISGSPHDIIGCAEAGLAGFIDQDSSIDDLVKAVTDAVKGEFSCSPKVTTILCTRLARLAGRRPVTLGSLTPREREIAGLVAEGLSNKEIAQGLRIGPATVKNHVHSILDKLNVRRRAAIAGRVSESAR